MAVETDRDENISPSIEEDDESIHRIPVHPGVPWDYSREEASHLFAVTHDQYVADRKADRRGTANPSIMNNHFWISQIGPGPIMIDLLDDSEDPVWRFKRIGATCTKLFDGRLICIGGEHGHCADCDFCVYNGRSFFSSVSARESRFTHSVGVLDFSFDPYP